MDPIGLPPAPSSCFSSVESPVDRSRRDGGLGSTAMPVIRDEVHGSALRVTGTITSSPDIGGLPLSPTPDHGSGAVPDSSPNSVFVSPKPFFNHGDETVSNLKKHLLRSAAAQFDGDAVEPQPKAQHNLPLMTTPVETETQPVLKKCTSPTATAGGGGSSATTATGTSEEDPDGLMLVLAPSPAGPLKGQKGRRLPHLLARHHRRIAEEDDDFFNEDEDEEEEDEEGRKHLADFQERCHVSSTSQGGPPGSNQTQSNSFAPNKMNGIPRLRLAFAQGLEQSKASSERMTMKRVMSESFMHWEKMTARSGEEERRLGLIRKNSCVNLDQLHSSRATLAMLKSDISSSTRLDRDPATNGTSVEEPGTPSDNPPDPRGQSLGQVELLTSSAGGYLQQESNYGSVRSERPVRLGGSTGDPADYYHCTDVRESSPDGEGRSQHTNTSSSSESAGQFRQSWVSSSHVPPDGNCPQQASTCPNSASSSPVVVSPPYPEEYRPQVILGNAPQGSLFINSGTSVKPVPTNEKARKTARRPADADKQSAFAYNPARSVCRRGDSHVLRQSSFVPAPQSARVFQDSGGESGSSSGGESNAAVYRIEPPLRRAASSIVPGQAPRSVAPILKLKSAHTAAFITSDLFSARQRRAEQVIRGVWEQRKRVRQAETTFTYAIAANTVATAWKKVLARRQMEFNQLVDTIRKVRQVAAITIQKYWRGYRTRYFVHQEVCRTKISYWDPELARSTNLQDLDIKVVGGFTVPAWQVQVPMRYCPMRKMHVLNVDHVPQAVYACKFVVDGEFRTCATLYSSVLTRDGIENSAVPVMSHPRRSFWLQKLGLGYMRGKSSADYSPTTAASALSTPQPRLPPRPCPAAWAASTAPSSPQSEVRAKASRSRRQDAHPPPQSPPRSSPPSSAATQQQHSQDRSVWTSSSCSSPPSTSSSDVSSVVPALPLDFRHCHRDCARTVLSQSLSSISTEASAQSMAGGATQGHELMESSQSEVPKNTGMGGSSAFALRPSAVMSSLPEPRVAWGWENNSTVIDQSPQVPVGVAGSTRRPHPPEPSPIRASQRVSTPACITET